MHHTLALGFSDIGTGEILLVGVIALLLFGRDLPNVIKKVGKTYAQVKKALADASSEIHREIDSAALAEEMKKIGTDVEKSVATDLPSAGSIGNTDSNGNNSSNGAGAHSSPAPSTARTADKPAEALQTGKAQTSISQAAALDALQRNIPPPSKIPPPIS